MGNVCCGGSLGRMFLERINHVTGEREWAVAEDEFDLTQEIARSRFGDMILDLDRNDRYDAALRRVIGEMKEAGKYVHVLDIGTGTGLLSLMAARAGADRVMALEVFQPMAECARKVIAASEYRERITVIAHRSRDLSELGLPPEQMPTVIVAEVFDTELIGEGALRTFKEALEKLAQPGCRVIPCSARVWALPVKSRLLRVCDSVPLIRGGEDDKEEDAKYQKRKVKLENTTEIGRGPEGFAEAELAFRAKKLPFSCCPGSSAVHDIQLSEMRAGVDFIALAKPSVVFQFNFESSSAIQYDEERITVLEAERAGDVDGVMMWWDVDMDGRGYDGNGDRDAGRNVLTMAPTWHDPSSKWRDHWMQAVYYLPEKARLADGQLFPLRCAHDEFSLWFTVPTGSKSPRPYCTCMLHSLLSRYSLYRINELHRNERLRNTLDEECASLRVVALGEASFIGFMAAEMAVEVIIVETNSHLRLVYEKYRRHGNGAPNVRIVASAEEIKMKPDVIVSEPFFLSVMLPWLHLRFWFEAHEIRKRFRDGGKEIKTMPRSCTLYALPMRFEHLHKIANRVGTVNGFDLSEFDRLSEKARSAVDALVEEHALWEYAGQAAAPAPIPLVTVDLQGSPHDFGATKQLYMGPSANAIALWMDWQLAPHCNHSTGCILNYSSTEYSSTDKSTWRPEWTRGYKQGVFFLPEISEAESEVHVKIDFAAETGECTFNFCREELKTSD